MFLPFCDYSTLFLFADNLSAKFVGQSVGEICRPICPIRPPTLGDFSPTLGGPPSLRSTVTICHSDPSVIVRPPTLGGFEILQKGKIYDGLFQI